MRYQNLLLIDDDHEDHEIFLAAVEEIPGPVSCVALTEAVQALQKLAAREITPDVIFLDLNMPVMNGQQFLAAIKQDDALKSIPVIIFSTSSSQATMRLTKELGAAGFITKPDTYDALVQILTSVVHEK